MWRMWCLICIEKGFRVDFSAVLVPRDCSIFAATDKGIDFHALGFQVLNIKVAQQKKDAQYKFPTWQLIR